MACKGSAVRSRLAPPNEQGLPCLVLVLCSRSPSSSRPRTPGFHLGNRGSNPLGDAINRKARLARAFLFMVFMGLAGCRRDSTQSEILGDDVGTFVFRDRKVRR